MKKRTKKATKKAHWTSYLVQLGACDVEQYRKYATVQEAWAACTDPSDLAWFIQKLCDWDHDFSQCCKLDSVCTRCLGSETSIAPFDCIDQSAEDAGHFRVFKGRTFTQAEWIPFLKTAFPVPDLWALKEACAGRTPWVPA